VADFPGRPRTARCAGPTPPTAAPHIQPAAGLWLKAMQTADRTQAWRSSADGMRAANVAASPSRPSTIAKSRWARREASAVGTPPSRAGPARTDPPPADPRDGLRDHRLELSVVDGGPGRRLYDAAGFEIIARVLSIPLPREHVLDDAPLPDGR